MRTFAQKQNQPPERVSSSSLARSNSAARAPGQGRQLGVPHLQRSIGNQALQRMLRAAAPPPRAPVLIQTKLTINQPGDQFEQEADRVADQVMRMPHLGIVASAAPGVQRKCSCGGTCDKCEAKQEQIQMKRAGSGDLSQTEAPPIVHEVLRSPGRPLDPATRAFMEPRFGHDFSSVRVHSDALADQSARAVNAHAYTAGQDMVFRTDRFAPRTPEGARLLAHELTHVLHQSDPSLPNVGSSSHFSIQNSASAQIARAPDPGTGERCHPAAKPLSRSFIVQAVLISPSNKSQSSLKGQDTLSLIDPTH